MKKKLIALMMMLVMVLCLSACGGGGEAEPAADSEAAETAETETSDTAEAAAPEDIIVDEDVWIGARVTLCAGCHINKGSIIAAGAVVTKELPPYSVCGGVPARFIKFKWSVEEILEHESKLYPEEERYTREQLEEYFSKF